MLRTHRLAATAAVAAAMAAPAGAAAAPAVDLRSPDAAGAPATQDLRAPDTAEAPTVAPTARDLRSPDVRLGLPSAEAATPTVRTVEAGPDGFAWGDAGLGAAGALVLVLAPLGAAAVQRRRVRPLSR